VTTTATPGTSSRPDEDTVVIQRPSTQDSTGDVTAELPRPRTRIRPDDIDTTVLTTVDTPPAGPANRWPGLVPVTLTALVTAVLAWNMSGFPAASDDEGTYLAQAWAVQHGLGLAHYTYWYDHPPLAWIQLAALSWLPALVSPDGLSVGVGRVAMLPVAVASLLLVYRLGRRLGLSRWAANLAIVLYGLSPLSVTMLRQLYLDQFAVLWILLAFVLALSPRRHLWHFVAAGAAAAVAILSKETMLVAVPGVLVALWQGTARTAVRPWAFVGFTTGFGAVLSFYPLYAVLKGELVPGPGHVSLVGALMFQLGRPGSGSLLVPGSGSNVLLHSWLYYDAVLIVAGVVAAVTALAVRRLRSVAVAAVALVLMAVRPGYLPAMYVIQVLALFAVLVAGLADVGARRLLGGEHRKPLRWLRWGAIGLVAVIAVGAVAPGWYRGDRRDLDTDANAGYDAAAVYLRTAIPDRADAIVVVDDVLWLDLVRAGYPRDHVLWFYKVDLDPAVAARLPHGWSDVDYIVSTPAMRQDPNSLPTVHTLLSRSTRIAAFGAGDGLIEVRRVERGAP
jgi:4-amino-4-deoxy-L-arabinose transferase-like glycosyltransferase